MKEWLNDLWILFLEWLAVAVMFLIYSMVLIILLFGAVAVPVAISILILHLCGVI